MVGAVKVDARGLCPHVSLQQGAAAAPTHSRAPRSPLGCLVAPHCFGSTPHTCTLLRRSVLPIMHHVSGTSLFRVPWLHPAACCGRCPLGAGGVGVPTALPCRTPLFFFIQDMCPHSMFQSGRTPLVSAWSCPRTVRVTRVLCLRASAYVVVVCSVVLELICVRWEASLPFISLLLFSKGMPRWPRQHSSPLISQVDKIASDEGHRNA